MTGWLKAFIQRLRVSLFLKILLVLVLAGAAIASLVMKGFRLAREADIRRGGSGLARQYAGHLVGELGDPPQEAPALRLAAQGLWQLRFVPAPGSTLQGWSTSPMMPHPAALATWRMGPDWGWRNGTFFTVIPRQGGDLLMVAKPWSDLRVDWSWGLALGSALFLVLALVWLAVEWLLQPVRWLDEGMARVSSGDLEHRIPTRESDELGRLAVEFNRLAERVQEMLEQRRRLLLDVSHELRSPLTRMKLGLEALPEGPERQSLSEDVVQLETLVSELLEGARLAHGRSQLAMESMDLAAVVRETAAAFAGRAPGLEVDAPASLPMQGDRLRLQRLIQNLLANAYTHGVPAQGPVVVRLSTGPGQAVLTVTDTGPGVPPAALERLFTPFFRLDSSRNRGTGGVGLGLHLCQRVAQAHGGDLNAALAPQGGLVFTLTLPLA